MYMVPQSKKTPSSLLVLYDQWQDSYKTLPKQLGNEIKFIQGLSELKENIGDDLR